MSAPLVFVREGRTLPFVPVTMQALRAISDAAPPRRLAYARSMYLALLEHANEQRGDRAALSRKALGERTGCSPDLISDLAPILVKACVIEVHERHHAGQRLENEWVIVEPPESRTPLATSHDPLGAQPQQSLENNKKNREEPPVSPICPEIYDGAEKGEIATVWAHYQTEFPKGAPQRSLDGTRTRIIERALKVRPKTTVLAAITGLAASKHHRDGGYTDIRYALKGKPREGESDEARIDMMAAKCKPGRADPMKKRSDAWAPSL